MDCPTEEALIRSKLEKLPQVQDLQFNLLNRTLSVRHTPLANQVLVEVIASVGMRAEPLATTVSTRVLIAQMDCPTEQQLITNKLSGMPGIAAMQFNLLQRTLTINHDPDTLARALSAIRELGFTPQLETEAKASAEAPSPGKSHWWRLGLSGVAAVSSEILHFSNLVPEWVVAVISAAAILLCGLAIYKKGWIALKNRNLNINALMSIAVTGAVLIGQWPEAAMVMFLFAVAELIEAKSLDRARNAIRGLMDLAPETATIQQVDGHWVETEVTGIAIGSVVRARPGERISLDGEVLRGNSTINQAPITGESLPVEKTVGDPVFAGTINQAGELEYRVTAEANHSTLARIIHAVEEAQGARAPTQRFVDQFSRVYTPAVFVFSLTVAIMPPLLMGAEWFEWIYRALVLLVVACPCALVISTPVTIVSGLAAAARKGILIKGGVYLEVGRKITYLALDKTGTITHGKPVQTDFMPLADGAPRNYRAVAASLADRSDHPVSQAIAMQAAEQFVPLLNVEGFEALLGRGVRGTIDGHRYHLGNHRLLNELSLSSTAIEAALDYLERQGKTVVILSDETQALALFAVADTVKETSRTAIDKLHDLGVKTLMLTGDNPHTAETIAAQVGIDEAKGSLLPNDKLNAIEALIKRRHTVGMVGDGINDAPALACANVGFAMGAAGTDTAIETADVAIMDDDLRKIPAFIQLSRQTAAVLTQNIGLALGIKAIFLVVTLTGQATMWMAVFADMGVSLIVVLNGLRLLRK
ncbi:4-deoxy-4-formamido-L-arabinose-phospho-UDP deformylase [Pseudomonas sp. ADP]|nr:4-deoxy-4-formamido-L-arabinose-phospho-UDP deformylase [Pseudomonas sp. ADP]OBP11260.1 4-deoxy-4-formamido-L-arabinose-phospho-UDP deformylase [Pseudomonas sp. EGD-AKN5]QOF88234.1 heavy metal translocating P-type ATPase [Pseudomonas sp. ADPe]